jgi:hypothetical protein
MTNVPVAIPITTHQEQRDIERTHYIETIPEDVKLQDCWRYSKTVKILSGIDVFFCLLAGLMDNPIFLIFMLLPYSGYKGAKEYNICYLGLYVIYCFILLIVKSVQFYNVVYKRYDYLDKYSDDYIIWLSVFNGLYIIVQLWITTIVIKFYNQLLIINAIDRNKLLVGTYIPVVTTYIFH